LVDEKMEISELQREDEKAWDEYVLKTEHSTFYHQIGWRNVVAKTYKHIPVYLIAKEGGRHSQSKNLKSVI